MKKSPQWGRCHHRNLKRTSKTHERPTTKRSSIVVLVLFNVLERGADVLKIIPRAPPNTKHLYSETSNHNFRAGIGTRINIPRPFLRTPDGINEDGMEPGSPQQKRSCPSDIRIELVVQTSGTKHANDHRGQDSRHDEGWVNLSGYLFFDAVW